MQRQQRYTAPKARTKRVRLIAEGYHVSKDRAKKIDVVDVNADHWKSALHERLGQPSDAAGALTLFHALPNEHRSWSKHITAEHEVEEFVPGRGVVKRWVSERRTNHWLDAGYLGVAAGHFCGVRIQEIGGRSEEVGGTPAVQAGGKGTDWWGKK